MRSSSARSLVRRAAAITLEALETRRLLSYSLSQSIYDAPSSADENFGQTLATNGDLALISAPFKDGGVGEVKLVNTATNTLVQTFSNPDASANDAFGSATAFLSGGRIAIGAVTAGPTGSGKVWIYSSANDSTPLEIASPYNSTNVFNGFGTAIAAYGDDILISTSTTGVGNVNGEVTLYDSNTAAPIRTFANYIGSVEDQMGARLAVDGTSFLATTRDNTTANDNMVVLEINGETGDLIRTYSDPAGENLGFGFGIAYSNTSTFINGATGVYQFDKFTGTQIRDYTNPSGEPFGPEGFGVSFAIGGNDIFIGAPFTNKVVGENVFPEGAAYVFDIITGAQKGSVENPTPFLVAPDFGNGDQFGYAIAATADGGFIVADPYDDDAGAIDSGGVYAFTVDDIVVPPTNHAPSANGSASLSTAVRQQSIAFTGSFTDEDTGDTHQVSWDFGDGTVIAFHSSTDSGALSPSHTYVTTGSFNVTFTVRDNSNASSTKTIPVTIAVAALEGNNLYVGGGSGNDNLAVNGVGGAVTVTNGNAAAGSFNVPGVIFMLGGDGNDGLSVSATVTRSAEIFGGAGADIITGGGGSDFLYGGDGNDTVTARGASDFVFGEAGNDVASGGEGRDIVVGGTGADVINGDADDDILIAGTTDFDQNRAALLAIQAEWNSGRHYDDRVENLRNGTGSAVRANGSTFLLADVTVHNDNAIDSLTGGKGKDWFLVNRDLAGGRDVLFDNTGAEVTDDLD